jgi:FAD/FMN-containing dehydrogenase
VCAALGEAGRAFPTGHHAEVALGGFLLGGGMGWNGEHWGQFGSFNVEALDVILADGEAATISADNHSELFWAARGAGPLFCAAVTRFHLRTYPLPTAIRAMRMVWPLTDAPALSAWLAAEGDKRRDDVEIILMFMTDPVSGQPCSVLLALYHGSDASAGEAALAEIASAAPPGGEGPPGPFPLTYAALYSQSLTGDARRTGADTIWTDDVAKASAILAEQMARVPSPGTVGIVNFRGDGALTADAACSMIGRGFLQWIGQWIDPAADDENFGWVQDVADALLPVTKGCYINETDILRRPERLERCFSGGAWARLQAVRERYDPAGRFPAPLPDLR